jgi:hypothetical protein
MIRTISSGTLQNVPPFAAVSGDDLEDPGPESMTLDEIDSTEFT